MTTKPTDLKLIHDCPDCTGEEWEGATDYDYTDTCPRCKREDAIAYRKTQRIPEKVAPEVEEIVNLRRWACNNFGEFFKRYPHSEKEQLWFSADEVEKIITNVITTLHQKHVEDLQKAVLKGERLRIIEQIREEERAKLQAEAPTCYCKDKGVIELVEDAVKDAYEHAEIVRQRTLNELSDWIKTEMPSGFNEVMLINKIAELQGSPTKIDKQV